MSSMTKVDGYYASWEEVREDRKLQRELDEKRKLAKSSKKKNKNKRGEVKFNGIR